MIASLLPEGVETCESRGDSSEGRLYPEEMRHIRRAVPKRRQEFVSGRACARTALARLGISARPIPVGPHGAPIWPPGVVGSITHCDGLRACAVANRSDYVGVGIDAEPNLPLPAGVLPDIAQPVEELSIDQARALDPSISWDRLLFCIKESIYKVWHPITGLCLGFHDARIRLDPTGGTFAAQVEKDGPAVTRLGLNRLCGSWCQVDGFLMVALAIAAPRSEATSSGKAGR
jgi:4'-phosphopantetheinyl transferase EntD